MKSLFERRKNPAAGSENSGSSSGSNEKKSEGSSDDKDVVVLTDSNFDSMLKNSPDLWLIEFYGIFSILDHF